MHRLNPTTADALTGKLSMDEMTLKDRNPLGELVRVANLGSNYNTSSLSGLRPAGTGSNLT